MNAALSLGHSSRSNAVGHASEQGSPVPESAAHIEGSRTSGERIVVVIGTRAQLIKMAPVMVEMETREVPFRLILTGQHGLTMDDLLGEFGVRTPPEPLFDEQEITGLLQMLFWFPRAIVRLLHKRSARDRNERRVHQFVLAHGDTASTLVAAIAGRLQRASVAHVEAGLRSFNLFDPFPEELVRILVGRMSTIAFAPGAWASGNLKSRRLEVVDTGANTLIDAVRFALQKKEAEGEVRDANYCVISIHRFETLMSGKRLRWLVEEIRELADRIRAVFVLHPATRRKLKELGLYRALADMPHVELRARMTYVPFIHLLKDAAFVITDGGSNQEELAYMGKPVLILRRSTERRDGLGAGAMLCNFDRCSFRLFVRKANERAGLYGSDYALNSPSSVIVDRLVRHVDASDSTSQS